MSVELLNQAQQMLTTFGQQQVPLIGYCQPQLLAISAESCEIIIPLTTKTENHVHSLYFGTLAVGADITAGLIAMLLGQQSGYQIELLFKDFKADFKRRAIADTHFRCDDGAIIQQMIQQTVNSGERVKQSISVTATTPSVSGAEVIAEFKLTLCLKHKTH